jgi:tetratricopeptide (TPR) repeat protein
MTADNNKIKIAKDCFLKGNQAMEKKNFDYAVKMHGTAVQLVPDNLVFRQTLRGCERKLYADNKTGAKMAGIRLTGVRQRVKKARSKSDWPGMDQAAEEGLAVNPWDAQLNADVGEACFHLGYTDIAEFGYEAAVEYEPENKGLLEKLADIHELRGNFTEARTCWGRILKLDPLNGRARSKMTEMDAKQTIEHGGYEGAKSTQEVRRSAYDDYRPATQSHVPESVAGPGVSLEADLLRGIRKNPTDKSNYIKLSDFYQRQKEFAKAADILNQVLEVSGGDYNIRELVEDNDLARLAHNLDLAKSGSADDESARKMVESLKREMHLRQIEVFSSRVERYPMDAGIKYQLAEKHMHVKDYKKAIPLLQQATADIRHEAKVRVALGKCFIAEKQNPLARYQFEKAVEKLNPHDNADLFCDARYYLGRLYDEFKDREKAEEQYNQVLSVDYNFKDARERLERLQRGDDHDGKSRDKR